MKNKRCCGRCNHAGVAFFAPHHGLCVHCNHPDNNVRGEDGWGTLRNYKERNRNDGDCFIAKPDKTAEKGAVK